MAYSYDEILERMENKYFELTGHEAAECGDIGIRLRLLAGELYSLGSNMDWLKRQMYFTTATGEQLDMYAMQRGLKRIRGKKSSGELAIVLDTPLDYNQDSVPCSCGAHRQKIQCRQECYYNYGYIFFCRYVY